MPASLSEAFGPDYSNYSSSNTQHKKKKNSKQANYGHQIPSRKYLSHEPKQEINVAIDGYNGNIDDINSDDQFLKISGNDYGPTDYNIKPQGIDEYAFQMQNINMMKDEPVDKNVVGKIIKAPINNVYKNNQQNKADVDVNFINEEDFEDSTTKSQQEQEARIKEFNDKLDLILNKLGHFDEPSQENIHDIILFVIFGCFVIFILDSIYRVGRMTF